MTSLSVNNAHLLELIDRPSTYKSSPLTQALILWLLRGQTQAQSIRRKLITNLHLTCNENWLQTSDLLSVCVVVGSLYTVKPELLGGDVLAHVAKRLVNAESAVGGPYRNQQGIVEPSTNFAVTFLMTNLGSPLPKVEKYLAGFSRPVDMILPAYPKSAALNAARQLNTKPQKPKADNTNSKVHKAITQRAHKETEALDEPLRSSTSAMIRKIQRADKNHEILLFPRFFASSLKTQITTDEMLDELGLANLFTWLSYTIFDDFIDEEGQPSLMPVATFGFQKTLRYYADMSSSQTWRHQILPIFADIDQANAWEIEHCRANRIDDTITFSTLPNYQQRQQLARRSFAHVLGPLIIIEQLPDVSARQKQFVRSGLRHYLIARQLNDDAFDWRKDINVGQLSYVVTTILRSLRIQPGSYNFEKLLTRMQRSFWRRDIHTICEQTLTHINMARRAFADSQLFTGKGEFFALLSSIENVAKQSLANHAEQQKFLKTYTQKSV